MKLPRGARADEFMEVRFKPGSWERSGIPEAGCRIRQQTFERILNQRGAFQIHGLIHALMDWLDVTEEPEPALQTLRLLLDRHYPADGRTKARCCFRPDQGCDLIVHIASRIDHDKPLVTWQRRGWVIALGAPSETEKGRLEVAAPAPISLKVAESILGWGTTSFMEEPYDGFEGARASSRRTASFYRWEGGAATIISWEYGLGITDNPRGIDADALIQPPADGWLSVNQLAIQVAIAGGYVT